MTEPKIMIFTDRWSGHEVMLVEAEGRPNLGLVYHPQHATDPMPWKADCDHCLGGRQMGLPLHVKREIKLLCSLVRNDGIATCRTPSNSEPYHLFFSDDGKEKKALVVGSGSKSPLEVILRKSNSRMEFSSNRRDYQSPIMLRCLTFVFSARQPSPREVKAIAHPLVARQRKHGIAIGHRHPCGKIDWHSAITGT